VNLRPSEGRGLRIPSGAAPVLFTVALGQTKEMQEQGRIRSRGEPTVAGSQTWWIAERGPAHSPSRDTTAPGTCTIPGPAGLRAHIHRKEHEPLKARRRSVQRDKFPQALSRSGVGHTKVPTAGHVAAVVAADSNQEGPDGTVWG